MRMSRTVLGGALGETPEVYSLCRAICVAPAWTGYTHMRLASEGSAQGQAQAYAPRYARRVSCQYIQPQYIGNVPIDRPWIQALVVTLGDATGKGPRGI